MCYAAGKRISREDSAVVPCRCLLICLFVLLAAFPGRLHAAEPIGPAPGPLRIIGGAFAGGCFAGGEQLPSSGPGFQTIHRDRSQFWGAPQTIADIELLAREAEAHGFPTLLVEDISRPRGGRYPPHAAHEMGLAVDIALDMRPRPPLDAAQRASIVLPSLVRPDQRGVDQATWSTRVVTLLHLAATLPHLDRVLVNPAIKRHLCRTVQGDRSWLRRIRPWWGHDAHMHVHFLCPAGQRDCVNQPPPPPGDGCDATLRWWFDQATVPPPFPKPHHPRPPLPAACHAILDGAEG